VENHGATVTSHVRIPRVFAEHRTKVVTCVVTLTLIAQNLRLMSAWKAHQRRCPLLPQARHRRHPHLHRHQLLNQLVIPRRSQNNTNCVCNTVLATAGLGEPFWDCGIGCSGATGADYNQYPGTPGYGGCPANKYNDGRDCCRCVQTTCPNGQPVDASTCQCPSPSPTPTQSPVISGGGGGYEGDGFPCTDYYWVYYVSYDGRGEYEYAGCW
jgi:hypothetical protein